MCALFNFVKILGVKRIRREFIDDLWRQASIVKESEWKTSAREHLMEFEHQLHEAVDAGFSHSSSRVSSWSLTNSIYYSKTTVNSVSNRDNYNQNKNVPSLSANPCLCIIFDMQMLP